MLRFLYLFLISISFLYVHGQTPAFPGAEGHGRYATGGRGGVVYYVTTLVDNNTGNSTTREGSLRWCINQSGARTILFKVSGTIFLNSQLDIKNGNLTIVGQSAPGDGICVAGYPVAVSASNIIIRYLRFRMGDEKISATQAEARDALGGRFQKNVMIDHCSVSWSTDECSSFYQNENFTMQWCIISESLRLSKHAKGSHGYGGIWGGTNATFHHNLVAHHDNRNPRLGPGQDTDPHTETVDLRNNVIYNWVGNSAYGGEAMNVNIVNCYYKPGPSTPTGTKRGRIMSIDKSKDATNPKYIKRFNIWGQYYIDGNVIGDTDSDSQNATRDNWTYGVFNQFHGSYGTVSEADKEAIRMKAQFNPGVITTHTAELAYQQVLSYAGASLRRDEIDERIVNETRNRTAAFKGLSPNNSGGYPKAGIIDSQNDLKPNDATAGWSAWPLLKQEAAPEDSDRDGIPDGWLETNYPGKTAADKNEQGYTYLEVYLNGFVASITEAQNKGGVLMGINKTRQQDHRNLIRYNRSKSQLLIDAAERVDCIEIYSATGSLFQRLKLREGQTDAILNRLNNDIYIVRLLNKNQETIYSSKIH
jgi:hypothetical protein